MKYQKINSLFKRDENNLIIPTEYCKEEFKYLENLKWECTEKIDGTNMRVEITPVYESEFLESTSVFVQKFVKFQIDIKGKTDNANIPQHLLKKMQQIFTYDNVYNAFADKYVLNETNTTPNLAKIIIYGEGYGVKIQKGGNYISNDVDFILFDVNIGNYWLNRYSIENIAEKMHLKIVPIIGYFTINEAIDYVKTGFYSKIAENKEYIAEGLVLRTPCGLLDRSGERLITKIKYKDFQDLKLKSPKLYKVYKRNIEGVYSSEVYMAKRENKKDALEVLNKYKSIDPSGFYLIKEINKSTGEIYHEIYD